MNNVHKWTESQLNYLYNETKGLTAREIQEHLNKTYNLNLTLHHIRGKLVRCNIKPRENQKGVKLGTPSKLKGRKKEYISEKQRATMFKKGNFNGLPVGAERVGKDGYTYVKIAQPNKWKLKARIIWEQYHQREVPKNCQLVYLDRDRQNLDINNLDIAEKGVILTAINKGIYTNEAEINRTVINLVELERKIKKYSKSVQK